ncbi:histidine phosphatase family protein [Paucilactobacillus suebicus]|nr:histidine phosphatase family protein [Paucilactobacillus suebicus]
MTKLFFVRHGETLFNIMKKMQGWADSPLTEKGWADAKSAGKLLADVQFDAVYSSDLLRAMNTAKEIIRENHYLGDESVITDSNFREVFFGSFEGLGRKESWEKTGAPHGYHNKIEILRATDAKTARNWMKDADPMGMAENNDEVWRRINDGLEPFETTENQNILIVSHGTLIRTMATKFENWDPLDVDAPDNGSYTTFVFRDGQWRVDEYNIR